MKSKLNRRVSSIFDDIISIKLSPNSTLRLNFLWSTKRYILISKSSRASVLFISIFLIIESLLLRSLSVADVIAINNIHKNLKLRAI